MSVKKEDIYYLVEQLNENDQKTAYDFLDYLINRSHKSAFWDMFDKNNPDDDPLSEEEIKQLKSTSGYVTWEEGKREFQIPIAL